LPLTVCVYIHSIFFWWAKKIISLLQEWPWFWCQSKACMRLPISPS